VDSQFKLIWPMPGAQMKLRAAFLFAFLFFSMAPRGAFAQAVQPGTEIRVRLDERLDTGETPAGKTFTATVEQRVRLNRRITLTKGARVRGTVTEVVSSGRLKRPAVITLQLNGLGGAPIQTDPLQIDGNSHAKRNTALIGGGAMTGALLGAMAGGGKGALIGAAAGAGAGTTVAYATGKHEIVLPAETELVFVIGGEGPNPEEAGPAPQDAAMPSQQAYSGEYGPPRNESQDAYESSPAPVAPGSEVSVDIAIGNPPPREDYMEPSPGPEFVWVAGYWFPDGRHYIWHEGYWTRPPYEGAHWIAPRHDGNRFFEGYWDGDRGVVQHDHRWDHDRGRDFDGDEEHHDHGRHEGHRDDHHEDRRED
jgi:hypothetical protein